MVIHNRTRIVEGLNDNEILIVERIETNRLKVTFVNEGSLVEKHFGKDEVETIYEVIGENASKLWWKLFRKKIFMDKSTNFEGLERMCEELNLFHHRLIW